MTEIKWKCDDCGTVSSLKELNRDTINGGYPGEPHYTCPVCGSDYLEEAYQCNICGEWFPCDEVHGSVGQMACDDCLNEGITLENVNEFSDECPADIELSGIWSYVWDEDDINELLWKYFKKMPKDEQMKYLKEYVEDNKTEFGEFLAR